ncbi:hypothetical protein EUGRSUZ_E02210 [Eucalyptus grandis]|uniref:Uncharacterized protein n=2 Tax=Eucalyptus grandis TaxID=71139 RepID=A0ACC3KXP9_EUCGR|nr:hypothetical protein EUGRSUZ_E02210 [Eucalyptus grandis]
MSGQHSGPEACNSFISIQKNKCNSSILSLLIKAFSLIILGLKFRQSMMAQENCETLYIVKQDSCCC